MGLHLGGFFIILLPSCSDGLPLRVELNGTLSIEVVSSPHRTLVSGKAEHWKWHWDWKVDTDLTSLNLML